MSVRLITDGSSPADARRVVINADDPTARWRWRCPNRHCDWEPTNNHVWCATCASLHGVDPEYWELVDTKTGERVPWGAVELR
jgi:hypothetical protein